MCDHPTAPVTDGLNYEEALAEIERRRKAETDLDYSHKLKKGSRQGLTLHGNRHGQLCWGNGGWLEMPSKIISLDGGGETTLADGTVLKLPKMEVDWERYYAVYDDCPLLTDEEKADKDWYVLRYDIMF